jgi:Protein of unknown function (DUF5818)
MQSTILAVLVAVTVSAAGPAAQSPAPRPQSPEPKAQSQKRTFSGTITDSICAMGGHAQMRMGPTDADCTTACVTAHDAKYVLADGKDIYTLSDQRTPEKFAGQKVRVVGSLDAKTKTIQVDSITAAK